MKHTTSVKKTRNRSNQKYQLESPENSYRKKRKPEEETRINMYQTEILKHKHEKYTAKEERGNESLT